MKRPGERLRQWGIGIALLCLVAWLGTGWHLAVEPHELASPVVVDHHDDDDHDHSDGDGHDADDHLIPVVTRPVAAIAVSLALAPTASELFVPHVATPRPSPPRSDRAPKSDPPSSIRRPRAPPVG